MQVKIDGKNLVITLPIAKKGTMSKSGKSYTVATTNGNVKTGVKTDQGEITVGVNAYVVKED